MSIKVDGKVVVCPDCGKDRCWRKGRVPSRSGPKQRYVCFTCGRSFHLLPKPKSEKKSGKASPRKPERQPGQPGEPIFVNE